jgi:hypothetical protein
VEVRKTWIEEGKDVANGRLCGSVIATRKVKRVRPSIGALQFPMDLTATFSVGADSHRL